MKESLQAIQRARQSATLPRTIRQELHPKSRENGAAHSLLFVLSQLFTEFADISIDVDLQPT